MDNNRRYYGKHRQEFSFLAAKLNLQNALKVEGLMFYYKFSHNDPCKRVASLFVYVSIVTPEVTVHGLPDTILEGSTVLLSCATPRIKPEAADTYWMYGGVRYSGNLTTADNQDGTFLQSNFLQLRYVKTWYSWLIGIILIGIRLKDLT